VKNVCPDNLIRMVPRNNLKTRIVGVERLIAILVYDGDVNTCRRRITVRIHDGSLKQSCMIDCVSRD